MSKTKEEYTDQLNGLKEGSLKKLVITPEEFLVFQQAFMDFPTRKRIVGKAAEGGTITYHYDFDN